MDDKEPEDEKNHGMPHESRGAEEWGLMAFSNVLRLLFVVVPDRLCDIGNAVQSMITLGYLYIIWQAVAMVCVDVSLAQARGGGGSEVT